MRSAAIAIGVVVFLYVFRPFGLAIDSVAEALVLLGIAPLNFLIMLLIHELPFPTEPYRRAAIFSALVIGNTAYLVTWSENTPVLETGLTVVLVVALTAVIVYLWNRGNIPEQELVERDTRTATSPSSVTLSGESDQEILQLAPDELLFMSANGNYVDVHYRKGTNVATSMLRSPLAGLAAQVPGNMLVRCHRSHFANLAVARRIVRAKGRTLIEFDGGERIPVSRMFRQDVLAAISG